MRNLLPSLTRTRIILLLVLSTIFYLSACSGSHPIPSKVGNIHEQKLYDKKFAAQAKTANQHLSDIRQQFNLPSASVAVGINGKLVWAAANGLADIEAEIPATLKTVYRIGSTSKVITSIAMGKLFEDGKLDLDAPIQKYVPLFPLKEQVITARQLASHTAGIRHYSWMFSPPFNEFILNKPFDNLTQGLSIFQDAELEFKPGTNFLYSSYGYNLLGAVIEGASGQEYLHYLQKNIFKPLNITGISADYKNKEVANRAEFYQVDDNNNYSADWEVNSSHKWSIGGLVASPSDLVLLGNALMDNKLLSAETFSLLTTPQISTNGGENPSGYALGWRNGKSQFSVGEGEQVELGFIHHGGTSIGATTMFLIIPERNMVLAITTNGRFEQTNGFQNSITRIAEAFLEK